MVTEKIDVVDDPVCHHTLRQVYQFLMQKEDSAYAKFIYMHTYQWLSLPLPIWNLLRSRFPWHRVCSVAIFIPYHSHGRKRAGGTNQLSKQQNILHVQSALSRAGLRLELWTALSRVWQVAVQNDSSKASGCSPNRSLGNKSFSHTYWQHQNLYLIDAVRQFGYPSFFITISPYEWTLPFPSFLEDLHHHQYGKDVTELPILETILIAHVLEQIARGYLTRGNCNGWNTHVFANATHPNTGNLKTYFPETRTISHSFNGFTATTPPWPNQRHTVKTNTWLVSNTCQYSIPCSSTSISQWTILIILLLNWDFLKKRACHPPWSSLTSRCPPDTWRTGDTITDQFEHEGHKEFFINTIVSCIMSLHDILYLRRIRVVNGEVGDLSSIPVENWYPLSPLQRAILNNITTALTSR